MAGLIEHNMPKKKPMYSTNNAGSGFAPGEDIFMDRRPREQRPLPKANNAPTSPGEIMEANEGNPAPYDPERVELDPKTDTVEGRVEGIIARNSPLMQSAATRADQQSNRRGLLNSSMAVGAGQRAVIDTAMPIASQDAQTSFQAKGLNQAAGNEARQLGANMEFTSGRDAALHEQQLERDTLQNEQEMALQQLRGEQAVQLSQIENEYGNLRRASESAASFYNQTAAAIGNILGNPDMTERAKQALIDKQLQLLKGGLSVIGGISNLDLTGLLDFSGDGGAPSGNESPPPSSGLAPSVEREYQQFIDNPKGAFAKGRVLLLRSQYPELRDDTA